MSQTIRRKPTSARRAAARQGKAQQVRAARARTGSAVDTVMGWLPFTEQQLHTIFLAMILGAVVVLAWMAASFAGVPAMARDQLAAFSKQAGFEVRRVEVRGVKHLNELKVYERALAERDRAMPLVDIDRLRSELMELSWVEDARVSRQLPDTLVIDVIERKPVAVLKKADRLALIDATGHELETISEARAKGRLVVAGPSAGTQVEALASLLAAAPALKPQVREAEWIGNRRWNLTFKTGQVLALPEGAKNSAGALIKFAEIDGRNRLLGGKIEAFDMRSKERIYFRIPGRTDPAEQANIKPRVEGAGPQTASAETRTVVAKPKPEATKKGND